MLFKGYSRIPYSILETLHAKSTTEWCAHIPPWICHPNCAGHLLSISPTLQEVGTIQMRNNAKKPTDTCHVSLSSERRGGQREASISCNFAVDYIGRLLHHRRRGSHHVHNWHASPSPRNSATTTPIHTPSDALHWHLSWHVPLFYVDDPSLSMTRMVRVGWCPSDPVCCQSNHNGFTINPSATRPSHQHPSHVVNLDTSVSLESLRQRDRRFGTWLIPQDTKRTCRVVQELCK